MATGGTNKEVQGLGAGNMQWISPFQLVDENGNVAFKVASDGTTATITLPTTSNIVRTAQKRLMQSYAKVGATSGWVVNAADNLNSLARCPASQTSSTLVVPISGLKVGDTITSFHLVGQVESGGNAVTIDAALRKQTSAAADLVDASVGAMTQLVLTGGTAVDTILSVTNTNKASLADVVGADESFYVLITATTAGSTDIDLQAVAVTVTES